MSMSLTNIVLAALTSLTFNSQQVDPNYSKSDTNLTATAISRYLNPPQSDNPRNIPAATDPDFVLVDKYIKKIDYQLLEALNGKDGALESAWKTALESNYSGSTRALYHFRNRIEEFLQLSYESHTYFNAVEAVIGDIESFKELLKIFNDPLNDPKFSLELRKKKAPDFSTIRYSMVVKTSKKEVTLNYWNFSITETFAINDLNHDPSKLLSSEDREILDGLVCLLYVNRARVALKSLEELGSSGIIVLTGLYGLPSMKTDPYQDILDMLKTPGLSRRGLQIAQESLKYLENPFVISTVATGRGRDESEFRLILEKLKAMIQSHKESNQ